MTHNTVIELQMFVLYFCRSTKHYMRRIDIQILQRMAFRNMTFFRQPLLVLVYTLIVVSMTRLWASRACITHLTRLSLQPVDSSNQSFVEAIDTPENIEYSGLISRDTENLVRDSVAEHNIISDNLFKQGHASNNLRKRDRTVSFAKDPLQLILNERHVDQSFVIFELIFQNCKLNCSERKTISEHNGIERIVVNMTDRNTDRKFSGLLNSMVSKGVDLLVIDGFNNGQLEDFFKYLGKETPIRACLLRNFSWIGKEMTRKGFCRMENGANEDAVWIMWIKDLDWKRQFCSWHFIRMNP